jgi:hypothetical protein
MTKLMPALLAALLIASPALAGQNTATAETQTTQTTTALPAQTPTPLPGISPTHTPPGQPEGLNGAKKDTREYTLIWPDWESELETPANFNR